MAGEAARGWWGMALAKVCGLGGQWSVVRQWRAMTSAVGVQQGDAQR